MNPQGSWVREVKLPPGSSSSSAGVDGASSSSAGVIGASQAPEISGDGAESPADGVAGEAWGRGTRRLRHRTRSGVREHSGSIQCVYTPPGEQNFFDSLTRF